MEWFCSIKKISNYEERVSSVLVLNAKMPNIKIRRSFSTEENWQKNNQNLKNIYGKKIKSRSEAQLFSIITCSKFHIDLLDQLFLSTCVLSRNFQHFKRSKLSPVDIGLKTLSILKNTYFVNNWQKFKMPMIIIFEVIIINS